MEQRSLDSVMEDMRSVGLNIEMLASLNTCLERFCISRFLFRDLASPATEFGIKTKFDAVQQSVEKPRTSWEVVQRGVQTCKRVLVMR